MQKFKWRQADSGYEGDDFNGEIEAFDPEDAAENAWESLCWNDPDYYRGGDIEMLVDGVWVRYTVTVESVPEFHASKHE